MREDGIVTPGMHLIPKFPEYISTEEQLIWTKEQIYSGLRSEFNYCLEPLLEIENESNEYNKIMDKLEFFVKSIRFMIMNPNLPKPEAFFEDIPIYSSYKVPNGHIYCGPSDLWFGEDD